MSSRCAIIEVYPNYNKNGCVNYNLNFSYGCPQLNLMGYTDIEELINKIRKKLAGDDLK